MWAMRPPTVLVAAETTVERTVVTRRGRPELRHMLQLGVDVTVRRHDRHVSD